MERIDLVKWIGAAILALVSGAMIAQYMTVHPLQMSMFLVLAMVCLFALILLIVYGAKGWWRALAVVVALVAFVIGYGAMSGVILSREDTREIPPLLRAKGDPGEGHTAVIYFTHGEPETYDPIGWLNQFREFDEQDISFVPFLIRPYFIFKLREAYEKGDFRERGV